MRYGAPMTTALQEAPAVPDAPRITREEAAERLGVSLRTLDRYIERDLLGRERNPVTGRVTLDPEQVAELRAVRDRGRTT